MTLSGGRNDTVMDNTFSNNGAWGILFVPYPDSGHARRSTRSARTTAASRSAALGCVFDPEGDALLGNTFVNDGFFGNPTNADFGQIVLHAGLPSNCYADNTAPQGSAPANLEQLQPTCGVTTTTTNSDNTLLAQVECDSRPGAVPGRGELPGPDRRAPRAVAPGACRPWPTRAPACRRTPGALRAGRPAPRSGPRRARRPARPRRRGRPAYRRGPG